MRATLTPVSADEAYRHAQMVGLTLLAVLHNELGDLRRVKQVVKLTGMVNAAPDFTEHPYVINGCSDLFVDVFGDAGRHSRSAVGVDSLPGQHHGRDRGDRRDSGLTAAHFSTNTQISTSSQKLHR
ncbi:RidA family protein [Paraburkholderia caffeinilytica]|uniref:RidA family protein n=1 Tax=Paraburkholderia caffeinilytica TaxID=1761016 RepID=UPI001E59A812|nr:RidA family protein [Paraburkholderia caffeinilytica]